MQPNSKKQRTETSSLPSYQRLLEQSVIQSQLDDHQLPSLLPHHNAFQGPHLQPPADHTFQGPHLQRPDTQMLLRPHLQPPAPHIFQRPHPQPPAQQIIQRPSPQPISAEMQAQLRSLQIDRSLDKLYMNLQIIKSKNLIYTSSIQKALEDTNIIFSSDPNDIAKSSQIIAKANDCTKIASRLINQYKIWGKKESVFAFLLLTKLYGSSFEDIFKSTTSRDNEFTNIEQKQEIVEYFIDNFYDKVVPLLEIFNPQNIKTMLNLSKKDLARDVLTGLSELIKTDKFNELKKMFPDERDIGTFISKSSCSSTRPDIGLNDILENIDNLKLIHQKGFSYDQISKIFTNSRFNLKEQIKGFTKNLDSIEAIIHDENIDIKNQRRELFSKFLTNISKNYNDILPMFCKVNFFEILTPEFLRSKDVCRNTLQIFNKFFEAKDTHNLSPEYLRRLKSILTLRQSATKLSHILQAEEELDRPAQVRIFQIPSLPAKYPEHLTGISQSQPNSISGTASKTLQPQPEGKIVNVSIANLLSFQDPRSNGQAISREIGPR